MKALIIEDETAAALNLKAILKQAAPDIRVVDTLESVEESVDWLRANPQPDLLFMDIHLADGRADGPAQDRTHDREAESQRKAVEAAL